MGLSLFDQCSTIEENLSCSLSNDRSLTECLIHSSNDPLRCSYSFSHSSLWVDGIDPWTLTSFNEKKDSSRSRSYPLEFHSDLGLYLPRHEKPCSAPISTSKYHSSQSKGVNHVFQPERIRLLMKKEKDLLEQSDRISSKDKSRHFSDRSLFNENDQLKNLLKEHLTHLLTRGTTHLQREKSTDQLNEDEITLLHRTTTMNNSHSNSKKVQEEKCPSSSFGLTILPAESLSTKQQFQSISLEKMAQQRNSRQERHSSSSSSSSSSPTSSTSSTPTIASPNLTRPSTQPTPPQQQQQKQQPPAPSSFSSLFLCVFRMKTKCSLILF